MKERIKIYLSDWQYNAGIVGLCSILEYARDEIKYEKQYVEIEPKVLEGFEENILTIL